MVSSVRPLIHVPSIPLPTKQPLLEVRDLRVHFPFTQGSLFHRRKGLIRAVDGLNFTVHEGETLGIAGESGCGKSTAARAILNLVQPTGGTVLLDGVQISGLGEQAFRPVRRQIQMVFQDPFASLNPRMTAGRIIAEPMRVLGLHRRRERPQIVEQLMHRVGLNPRQVNCYPHEFSGGQRQRIGIARALAAQPRLIVCDEPVSALDVSIQAQVLNLLMDLQAELKLTYIFIAHDLSVVRHISNRIGVMYLGRIVELGPTEAICTRPRHPYTEALLSAVPIPDPVKEAARRPIVLNGEIPTPEEEYPGCPFADRCPLSELICLQSAPQMTGVRHRAACFLRERET
jgi:oligopeptide transport system ATP-binding protein